MNKAVLVFDMPEICKECPICASYEIMSSIEEYICTVKNINVDLNNKPEWCPLKPLPKRRKGYDSIKWQWGEYEDGWNHCINMLIDE